MPITITCPKCGQMCQVEDQHAGKLVGCPKCKNAIQVPPAAAVVSAIPMPAAPISAPPIPEAAEPVPPTTEVPPPKPIGQGLLETLNQSIAGFGLDSFTMKLLYAGMGCFAAMIVFTLLPWLVLQSIEIAGFGAQPRIETYSILGVQTGAGWTGILLTLGSAGFLMAVFLVLKDAKILDYALWTVTGWAALATLWRLVDVVRFGGLSGIGLYLSLFASLVAAASFGFVVFQRLSRKK